MSTKLQKAALATLIALAAMCSAPQKAQADYSNYEYNAWVYFTWATDHAYNNWLYYGGPGSFDSYVWCQYAQQYTYAGITDPSMRMWALRVAADAYYYAERAWIYSNGNSWAYWAYRRAYDGYVAAYYAVYYPA